MGLDMGQRLLPNRRNDLIIEDVLGGASACPVGGLTAPFLPAAATGAGGCRCIEQRGMS